MSILNLLKFPNEILKKKTTDLVNIDDDLHVLAKDMIETMFFYKGIGLAAPQIGVSKSLFVLSLNNLNEQALFLINPKIVFYYGVSFYKEGCLSFPNFFIDVKRSSTIKIKFLNLNGDTIFLKTDGLLSICIQHEIDHLNGITLYDKISKFKKKIYFRK